MYFFCYADYDKLYPPQNTSICLYALLLYEIRSRQLNETDGCQGNWTLVKL
jgi:hypothetical protein